MFKFIELKYVGRRATDHCFASDNTEFISCRILYGFTYLYNGDIYDNAKCSCANYIGSSNALGFPL